MTPCACECWFRFPRVPFSPDIKYCILDAERTVMQPAASKQRTGGRMVRRSLLAPRFPLVCPRIILFAAAAAPRTSTTDDEAIKPSRSRLLTLIRASDAAKTTSRTANKLSRRVCDFKYSQKKKSIRSPNIIYFSENKYK